MFKIWSESDTHPNPHLTFRSGTRLPMKKYVLTTLTISQLHVATYCCFLFIQHFICALNSWRLVPSFVFPFLFVQCNRFLWILGKLRLTFKLFVGHQNCYVNINLDKSLKLEEKKLYPALTCQQNLQMKMLCVLNKFIWWDESGRCTALVRLRQWWVTNGPC